MRINCCKNSQAQLKMKSYSLDFLQKNIDVYHNEPLSQKAIAECFCGASELWKKIDLHSIASPKILLLKLIDVGGNLNSRLNNWLF